MAVCRSWTMLLKRYQCFGPAAVASVWCLSRGWTVPMLCAIRIYCTVLWSAFQRIRPNARVSLIVRIRSWSHAGEHGSFYMKLPRLGITVSWLTISHRLFTGWLGITVSWLTTTHRLEISWPGITVRWLTIIHRLVINWLGITVSWLTISHQLSISWLGTTVSWLTISHRLVISWLGTTVSWLTISHGLVISWLGITVCWLDSRVTD